MTLDERITEAAAMPSGCWSDTLTNRISAFGLLLAILAFSGPLIVGAMVR